jgi:hypothetical protein
MKSLAVAAVALALVAAAPRVASAQEAGVTSGAVAATIIGAAVGGAVGYFYFTGITATTIGVIGGGAIGDWWYTAASSGSGTPARGKMKMNYSDTPPPSFQLIGYSGKSRPRLHTAAFSSAAD